MGFLKNTKEIVKGSVNFALQNLFFLASKRFELTPTLGTALVIAPHPDDDAIGCGATILQLRQQGIRVRILIVTNGEASTQSKVITPGHLAALRRTETQTAARILNVPETELVFLSYPDGQTGQSLEKITKDIAAQIWLSSPSLILAPFALDLHADHRLVAQALTHLCETGKVSCRILSYPTWFWPRGALRYLLTQPKNYRLLKISTEGFLEKKKAALLAHRSQFENLSGEAEWGHLSEAFLSLSLQRYELFFERIRA